MKITPKPDIMEIMPYKGGEGRIEGLDRLVRLASNESALGCSRKAQAAYQAGIMELHRYPDGSAADLKGALAETYNLKVDQIVCGNGSEELITLIARAYAGVGDEILYSEYGFLMYPLTAKAVGATPVAAPEGDDLRTDIQAVLKCVTPRTKLVFIANPNNPTGSVLTRAELEELHAGLSDETILVIDAAYAEFLEGDEYTSGADLVEKYNNVIMLRTFSKVHGLAALRVGWGYFPPEIADVINRIRGAFNVNVPAQAAAVAALSDAEFVTTSIAHNARMLSITTDYMTELGLKAYPSVCNFILVSFGTADRAEDIRQKLNARGIFIRQMGVYGLPEFLRISMGTDEEMKALFEHLSEVLAE